MKKCNNKECNNLTRNNRLYCSIKCSNIDKQFKYNNEPKKCKCCDEIIPYDKKENIFCDSNCAASFNNAKRKGKYVYHLSRQGLKNIQNTIKDVSKNRLFKIKSETEKINFYLKKPKKCVFCDVIINYENKKKKFCSDKCKYEYAKKNIDKIKDKLSYSLKKFYETDKGLKNIKNLSIINIGKEFSKETREKISVSKKLQCEDINERIRLKNIGRKGGFGKKGYTNNGIYYQSSFEKKCFEFLEDNNIFFEPHKNLPNSSKICDIYLPNIDIWIELDGINREKKKEWLGKDYDYWLNKLNEYNTKKLNFKVFYNYKEFVEFLK